MSDKFILLLKSLKPEDWEIKVNENWTVKDVVAHMVGWEKEDARIIEDVWKSKKRPWFYETENYDEFNQKYINYYRDFTPEELIAEWEKYQREVDLEIKKIGEENLRARPDLFGWLFDESEGSHHNYHYQQIKNIVTKNQSTGKNS